MRIVIAHMNPIDARGKADLEKAMEKTSKLLDVLVETRRTLD